jgi:hypothetical protein
MDRLFEKYKRFLGAVFLLWIFLRAANFFGFSFGVDLHLFLRFVFLLGGIWGIWGIWANWGTIYPLLKDFFAKQKSEFIQRTKATGAEIIAFSPKVLGGRTGSLLVLPLAVGLGVVGGIGGVGGRFFRLLFSKEGILLLGILGILLDIFVFDFTSDLVILFLLALWIRSVWSLKLEGRVSVAGALMFLSTCPFLLIFKKDPVAEKAAIWAYMFLVVGTIQMFVEFAKEEKKNVELAE